MERITAWNESKHGVRLWLGALFCVMAALNFMTPWVADDWVYMLNLVTKELLRSPGDVVESMMIHATNMNGRLLAHGLVQCFFLLPRWVFKLTNSLMFCGLMYVAYRLCRGEKEDLRLLLALSMGFFAAVPAFGQVCLWQVGSVNYLWALVLGTGFLLVYGRSFLKREAPGWAVWKKILFTLLGLVLGMYTEIMSFVSLGLGGALTLLGGKDLRKSWLWVPVAGGIAGYGVLLSMPAERRAKAGSFTLEALMGNLGTATFMLLRYLTPLLLIWAALMAAHLLRQGPNRRAGLSLLLFGGALAGNYMLIAAAYYPERCMYCAALLLVLASGVLLSAAREKPAAVLTLLAGAAFLLTLGIGTLHTYDTWQQARAREQMILSAISRGETDLTLPVVKSDDPRTAFWDLRDLAEGEWDTWPNSSMAKYYGVRSITGAAETGG